MKKCLLLISSFFFLCLCSPVLDTHAEAAPVLQPPPDLKIVEPKIQEWAKEAVESGMNEKGFNVPLTPEMSAMAFLDLNRSYVQQYWSEDEDFKYIVQPVIDASDMPEGFEGLDANLYFACAEFSLFKIEFYMNQAGEVIGNKTVTYKAEWDGYCDSLIEKLVNNYYYPVGVPDLSATQGAILGQYKATTKEFYYRLMMEPYQYNVNYNAGFVKAKITSVAPGSYAYIVKLPGNNYFDNFYNLIVITPSLSTPKIEYFSQTSSAQDAARVQLLQEFNSYTLGGTSNISDMEYFGRAGSSYVWYKQIDFDHKTPAPTTYRYCPWTMYTFNNMQEFVDYFIKNSSDLTHGGIKFTPNGATATNIGGQSYNIDDLAAYNNSVSSALETPLKVPETLPVTVPSANPLTVPAPVPVSAPSGPSDFSGAELEELNPGTKNPELAPYMFDLSKKFPFCVPFDLINAFKLLSAEPEVPVFKSTIKFEQLNFEYPIVIDFSPFEPVAKVFRIIMTISFIVGLIKLTRNLISN